MISPPNEEYYFSSGFFKDQEKVVQAQTEDFWGMGRNGFCDIASDGIEVMQKGLELYRSPPKPNPDFEKFADSILSYSYYHFYRVIYSFKAIYNLTITGYYTEAAILLRSVIESYIKLRYLNFRKDAELVGQALAGNAKYKGKKYPVNNKVMFDKIAPGLYSDYRHLSDMTHGSIASVFMKIKKTGISPDLDYGLEFKPKESSIIINQYSIYLLAHLELLMDTFPAIEINMSTVMKKKYKNIHDVVWRLIDDFSTREKNRDWIKVVIQILAPKAI